MQIIGALSHVVETIAQLQPDRQKLLVRRSYTEPPNTNLPNSTAGQQSPEQPCQGQSLLPVAPAAIAAADLAASAVLQCLLRVGFAGHPAEISHGKSGLHKHCDKSTAQVSAPLKLQHGAKRVHSETNLFAEKSLTNFLSWGRVPTMNGRYPCHSAQGLPSRYNSAR